MNFKTFITQESKINAPIDPSNSFGTVVVNQKEAIKERPGFFANVTEPEQTIEGYVKIYTNTGEIACRLRWDFDDTFGLKIPQTQMIETKKSFAGQKLSLLAYKELLDRYECLITDDRLTEASVMNWSKNMFPIYGKNMFIINKLKLIQWSGNPADIINTDYHIIIINNKAVLNVYKININLIDLYIYVDIIKTMIYYIDFDGTITDDCAAPPQIACKRVLEALKRNNHTIVLFSCRSNPECVNDIHISTQEMVYYMNRWNLPFDSIQLNKPLYNYLIDDRAFGCPKTDNHVVDWEQVEKKMEW